MMAVSFKGDLDSGDRKRELMHRIISNNNWCLKAKRGDSENELMLIGDGNNPKVSLVEGLRCRWLGACGNCG